MSCGDQLVPVVEVQGDSILCEVSPGETTVVEPEVSTVEIIEVAVQGPVGPQGPAGDGTAYFWEPEAAAALAPGQPCCVNETGRAILAGAADNTRPVVGLSAEATETGMGASVQVSGVFQLMDWTAVAGAASLAPGAIYYLSDVAGKLTASPPAGTGRSIQEVGRALSINRLLISIKNNGRRA